MAASLAAAIQRKFGITAQLVEGHHGIYEMTINGSVSYTNQSTCASGFPSNEEIFQLIGQYKDPYPVETVMENINDEFFVAPSCSLSDPAPKMEYQPTSCGCSSDAVEPAPAASDCCSPVIDLSLESIKPTSNKCCG